MEEDGEDIPVPSRVASIRTERGGSLAMIEAWMPPFREKMRNQSMNKTVTIPRWLDIAARKEKVNLSHLLQESLKQYLGLTEQRPQYL